MNARFIQDGNIIDYIPSADTSAGSVVIQGSLIGITKRDIPANTLGALALTGVYAVKKSGAAFAAGDVVYWNAVDKTATSATSGNMLLGVAVADAAAYAETVSVRLERVLRQEIPADGGNTVSGLRDAGQLEVIENGIYTPAAGFGYSSVNAAVSQSTKENFNWYYVAGPLDTPASSTEPNKQKSQGIFRVEIYKLSGNIQRRIKLYANIPQGETYRIVSAMLFMKAVYYSAAGNIVAGSNEANPHLTAFYLENNVWNKLSTNQNNSTIESAAVDLAGTGEETLYGSFFFTTTPGNCNNCFFLMNINAELI